MSPTITVTGLGSGIDLSQIVDQLVLVERNQINRLEIWKNEWEDKIESIQGLNSRLLSLESFVTDYNTETEFLATTATSSDEDLLTVSSDSSATTGAHEIEVATSTKHRLGSEGKASKTVTYAILDDTLDITVNGVTDNITFDGNYTLETMVTRINTQCDAQNNLVEASIIDDGSGENEFRLVLTANSAGSSNTISISNNITDLKFSMSGAGDRIDDVEYSSTWSGSPPADNLSSGGQYLGTTNKTFQFTISGSDTYKLGDADTGSFNVTWTDGEGNGGTISVTKDNYDTNLDVFQGVTISFGDAGEEVVGGETFSVDVWYPDLQAGQDEGLAKVEKEVHSGFSDTDTTAVTSADETFSYTYNGQKRLNLNVSAGTTLSGLVGLINNDSDNLGVTASIINDGSGLSTAYHLVLTGNKTGAAYKITSISHTLDNADFDNTFTEAQAAQNAMIKVDSYPSGDEYIQKSSNSISDVIEGVTLSLVSSGSSATVSITEDIDTIRTNIETFVNGVNFLLDYIKKETGYDEDTGEAGVMIGNYSYQIVAQRINKILADAIPGLTDGVDTYVHLAQIGIKTNPDNDGKWEIDSTALNNALSADLEAVSKLFIKDDVAGTDGIYELLRQELDDLTDSEDGPMNVLIEHYEDIIDGIDTKVEREERRIALVEGRLTDRFVALEVLLGQLSGQESFLLSLIESLPTVGGKKK